MSTPIETNTEELQEILQQVYDLPNSNASGSSEPDLVLRFEMPQGTSIWDITNDDIGVNNISVQSGNLSDVRYKLKTGATVKARVFFDVYYWDTPTKGFAEITSIVVYTDSDYMICRFLFNEKEFYVHIGSNGVISNFGFTDIVV